jgi:uncharacterized protein YbaR (Trm112 family)
MLRRAIIQVMAAEVICPNCKEPRSEPKSGSLMWEKSELYAQVLRCQNCKTEFELVPKSIKIN